MNSHINKIFKNSKNQKGMSLVEALIAVLIFSLIFGACLMVLLSGVDSFETSDMRAQLQQNLRKAMEKIKEDLRQSGASTITNVPADGTLYTTITFKTATGVSSSQITWDSNTITYTLASANLLRTYGGQIRVVATQISSVQFRRQSSTSDIVEVSLQAQDTTNKGRTFTDSLNFDVQLRN